MVWERKMLLTSLAMTTNYDKLDVTNIAAAELMARRVIMIERAVRVNPKAPVFTGLGKMIEHALEEGGGIASTEGGSALLCSTPLCLLGNRSRDPGRGCVLVCVGM